MSFNYYARCSSSPASSSNSLLKIHAPDPLPFPRVPQEHFLPALWYSAAETAQFPVFSIPSWSFTHSVISNSYFSLVKIHVRYCCDKKFSLVSSDGMLQICYADGYRYFCPAVRKSHLCLAVAWMRLWRWLMLGAEQNDEMVMGESENLRNKWTASEPPTVLRKYLENCYYVVILLWSLYDLEPWDFVQRISN